LCAAGLTAIFIVWYLTERTLSIHSINTRRREMFYWAAVLATFAMGTAVGDMSAYTLHLGWFTSGVLFTIILAIPMFARRLFGLNEVFAFWLPTSSRGRSARRTPTGLGCRRASAASTTGAERSPSA
jgi:uncharacterized membrane-anchored protein